MAKSISSSYDYIIVGAGAGGCVLANRLSEDGNNSVLLVEAGGPANSIFVEMPAGNGNVFANPKYDWSYESVPQPNLHGRKIFCARGKGFGGSTIMNGMVYTRGVVADYDNWKNAGLEGWGYSDLLPYFKKCESSWRGENDYHGSNGPLRITRCVNFKDIDRRFVDACNSAGYPWNNDFAGESATGVSQLDVMVSARGRRMGASSSYLRPVLSRPNLATLNHTKATRINIDNRRAQSVDLMIGNNIRQCTARKEILLCAGAYETPKLLLLSGIGAAAELQRLEIDTVLDIPGVGKNLQDHINIPVQFFCTDPKLSFAKWQRLDRAVWIGLLYFLFGKGPASGPFWGAGAFNAYDDSGRPDYQFYFDPMVLIEDVNSPYGKDASFMDKAGAKLFARGKSVISGFQFDMNIMQPKSVGSVSLASSDPADAPNIDLNYFDHDEDLKLGINAVREARNIASQPSLQEICAGEISPGADCQTDEEMAEAVRTIANTGHHPVSTCKMGNAEDKQSVVDQDCRVKGISGLRIVDASIFPSQICGNPTAPIMAIAERAADLVRGRPVLNPAEIG